MKKIVLILGIMLFTASLAFGADLNESFEGTFPPDEWTVINNDGGSYTWEVYATTSAYDGSYVARKHYESPSDDWLITPKLIPTEGHNNLSFWYKSYSSSYLEDFNVKLSTTETNVADFTVNLGSITGAPNAWTEFTFDLSAYNGTEIFIAVQCVSFYEYYLYVDYFTGVELYVPAYPKPTDLTTTNITKTTADLGWTEAGTATTWEIEWGATGFTQGTGTTITGITSNPYTLNPPLIAGTTYDWYVRSDCGDGNYSDWSRAEIFTTQFGPVTTFPWTEGFEDNWSGDPAAPPSWSQITVSGTNVWKINSYPRPDGGTYCAIAPFASAGGEHLLITPELVFGTNNFRLKFWLRGQSSVEDTDLKVQIADDNSAASNFTTDLAYFVAGTNMPSVWTEYTIDLSAYGSSQYIAFRMIDNDGGSLWIDDVTVEEIPTSPIFSIDPALKDFGTVNLGESSAAQTFTITNIGEGTLTIDPAISITGTDNTQFSITDVNTYPADLTAGQSMTVDVTFEPTSVGAKTANLSVESSAKVTHTAALSGTGINYNYGQGTGTPLYYFANSTTGASGAPSQPTYSWIDISTTGTDVSGTVSGDNSVGGPYEIGFTFNYFGVDYTQFWICADGYISLIEETESDFINDPIPNAADPNGMIALIWNDMDPGDTSVSDYHLYYGTSGGNMVITYEKMPEYSADENGWFTAQAILYPSGNINLQYKEVGSSFDLTSCTVGIENAAGDVGVQYLYNETGGPIYNGSPIALMFGTDESTLPVEILAGSFNAVYINNELGMEYVTVNWSTVTETDINGFSIYRSYEDDIATSGNSVNTSMIPGYGTTTEIHDYAFEDITADVYSTYYYWLEVVDISGQTYFHGPITFIPEEDNPHPADIPTTMLFGNYPNPATNNTTIRYQLQGPLSAQDATICIYNILGELVSKVSGEDRQAELDVSEFPTGIYFYKLETDTYHSVKKMVIVR